MTDPAEIIARRHLVVQARALLASEPDRSRAVVQLLEQCADALDRADTETGAVWSEVDTSPDPDRADIVRRLGLLEDQTHTLTARLETLRRQHFTLRGWVEGIAELLAAVDRRRWWRRG